MNALANRTDFSMPRSDFMSIDQKIVFEMDNIEDKLQRMLQIRADAIDRELQERWPTPPALEAEAQGSDRHCLRLVAAPRIAAPAVVADVPRPVVARMPLGPHAIPAPRNPAPLRRRLAAIRARVGTALRHRRSEPARLWSAIATVGRIVRQRTGATVWSPLRSLLAEMLGHVVGRSAVAPAVVMRPARWNRGEDYGQPSR